MFFKKRIFDPRTLKKEATPMVGSKVLVGDSSLNYKNLSMSNSETDFAGSLPKLHCPVCGLPMHIRNGAPYCLVCGCHAEVQPKVLKFYRIEKTPGYQLTLPMFSKIRGWLFGEGEV